MSDADCTPGREPRSVAANCDYFQLNQGMYSYQTRNKAGLHLRSVDTTFGQRCIKFKGSFLWNNLPNYIKNIGSIKKFKSELKFYLQQNWTLE